MAATILSHGVPGIQMVIDDRKQRSFWGLFFVSLITIVFVSDYHPALINFLL